ncbi:MAG: DNA mismatch repair endonuclease MutL [Verrucomicrobia bacterium]|nr:DNA mismatch repair endonuclease MutL [Verrucomicrobiota bacterium]
MSRIALLSETVASQVAAGEVIERPASVVKELVENALDAGARQIAVHVQRGGIALIRVSDDGHGMDRQDALLCLERHATSKLRTGRDLAAIATMGFRGEALPSIASVSRFRLVTREPSSLAGTEVLVNGGKVETVRDAGEAPGTLVEVRSLFFNLPARRKFLRTEETESAHVEATLHALALGNAGVGFTFVRDGRTVYQLPPALRLGDRVRDLCGPAQLEELLEIEGGDGGARPLVRGYIGKPGVSRSSRSSQLVWINGRPVENATVNHALREGYHTALMKGRHPVTFLFLNMDPAAVDVNVHPAKREVRFHRPSEVHATIASAVRRALESARTGWSGAFQGALTEKEEGERRKEEGGEAGPIPAEPELALPSSDGPLARISLYQPLPTSAPPDAPDFALAPESLPSPRAEQSPLPLSLAPAVPPEPAPAPSSLAAPPSSFPSLGNFRVLGVLAQLYILLEGKAGLVLVDQHAAHERILFEEFRRRLEAGETIAQRLLLPVTLEFGARDAEWIQRNLADLRHIGFELEPFGGGTYKLEALPPYLPLDAPQQLLREVIDELKAAGADTPRLRLGEEMIAKTVCRHAIKANDQLRPPEIERLLRDLLACELPYCCPHGRPTMIQLSLAELEKRFGRRN